MESTFKILSTRQIDELLYTEVEFNFDGELVQIDIGHSAPRSVEEIEQNIKNRGLMEIFKRTATQTVSNLVNDIPLRIEKPLE